MIAKGLVNKLLTKNTLYQFAKVASTQTGESAALKRGQISQVQIVNKKGYRCCR